MLPPRTFYVSPTTRVTPFRPDNGYNNNGSGFHYFEDFASMMKLFRIVLISGAGHGGPLKMIGMKAIVTMVIALFFSARAYHR